MIDREPSPRIAELKQSAKYARISIATTQPVNPAADAAEAAQGAKPAAIDAKTLQNALSNLTEHVQNLQRALEFSVDKESGETVVKVVDSETKEVIRQIPSEELLAIANRLRSTAGVLLAESV